MTPDLLIVRYTALLLQHLRLDPASTGTRHDHAQRRTAKRPGLGHDALCIPARGHSERNDAARAVKCPDSREHQHGPRLARETPITLDVMSN